MAKHRSSFAKLQRDRAKAAKRAAKAANRKNNTAFPEAISADAEPEEGVEVEAKPVHTLFEGKGELTAPQRLEMIEEVHRARERGEMSEEEFEDAKVEIFARLPVD